MAANPFDQFDPQPAANPFDQFDAPKPAAPKPTGPNPYNVGNLRAVGSSQFRSFDSPEEGVAANVQNLLAYNKRGLNTVSKIISTWAPPSDNNPTAAYIANVSRALGVDPNAPLNMQDPAVMSKLIAAIGVQEKGPKAFGSTFTPESISAGVSLGLGQAAKKPEAQKPAANPFDQFDTPAAKQELQKPAPATTPDSQKPANAIQAQMTPEKWSAIGGRGQPIKKPESVMAGYVAGQGKQEPLPSAERYVVDPKFIQAVEAQLNAVPKESRDKALARLVQRNDAYGRAARDIQGRYQAMDKLTPEAQQVFDPRLEAQAKKLEIQGDMEPQSAKAWAAQSLRRGVTPKILPSAVRDVVAEQAEIAAQQVKQEMEGAGFGARVGAEIGTRARNTGIGLAQIYADVAGDNELQKDLAVIRKFETAKGGAIPKGDSIAGQSAQQAIASLGGQAPMMVLGAMTGTALPVLAQMGIEVFSQNYGQGRNAGLKPAEASYRAGLMATAEITFGRYGLGDQLKALRGVIDRIPTKDLSGYLAASFLKEIPAEQATTLSQFLVDKLPGLGLNQNAGLKDLLEQSAETLRQTVIQAGASNAAIYGASKAERAYSEKVLPALSKDRALARAIEKGSERVEPTMGGFRAQSAVDGTQTMRAGRAEPRIGTEFVAPDLPGRVEPTVGPGTVTEPAGRVEPTMGGQPPPAAPQQRPGEPEAVPGMPTGDEVEELPVTPVTGTAATPSVTPVTGAAAPEAPKQVKLYRGVREGQDTQPTVGGALFMSPNRKVAEIYAGEKGSVTEVDADFQNLLDVPTWVDAKARLGLEQSATMEDIVNKARADGYDGVTFNTTNGREYISIPPTPPKARPATEALPFTPTGKGPTFKGSVAPTQAAARLPDTPTVAPVKPIKPFEPPAPQHKAADLPSVDVPIKMLKLSEDVPQFKYGADKKGVVKPLGGKFSREGLAPIAVWHRLDGSLEVISGRHRFDLAKRSGEETIPAQVYYESQGFTAMDAAIKDAELNIRDDQGQVKDYVNYFKESGMDRQTAESKGLLARDKGKRGFTIGNQGSDELIESLRADEITDNDAFYIALNAPNDPKIQAVGMKAVRDGKSINVATNLMQAVKVMSGGGLRGTTGDIFGDDTAALEEAAAMADYAAKKQREVQNRLSAISGVAKRPELAKAEGINVNDLDAVKRREGELRQLKAKWDNWYSNSEAIAEIREAIGATPFELTSESEAERQAREEQEAAEKEEKERKEIADREVDLFGLTAPPSEEQAAPTGDLFTGENAPSGPRQAAYELLRRASERLGKAESAYRNKEISKEDLAAVQDEYEKESAKFSETIRKLSEPTEPTETKEERVKKLRETRAGKPAEDLAEPEIQTGEIVRETKLPDGMVVNVFKTSDGYGTGLFDVDSNNYVGGSITRYKGKGALARANKKADDAVAKAASSEKPAAKPKELEPANIRQARKEMEAAAKTPGKVLTPAELSRRRDLIAYDQKKQAEALEAAGEKVVNGKPVDPNLPAKNRLVLMPCCDTKGDAKAPALELYKGVFFQTFKRNQKSGAEPNIVILSAKHGFIEPTKEIEPYDQVMTPEKAEEFLLTLQRDMDSIDWPDGIKDVLIVGGKQYQRVMRAAVARLQEDGVISKDASINVTSGGIGDQRSQLGKYLQAIPAEQPKAAEPEAKEETDFETEIEAAYKKNAESHAKDTGGEIVWRKGYNALIRAYDKRTGDPVYVVTFGGQRSIRDVESYTGTGVSPSIKQEMIEAKKKAEQEAEEKHKTNPFIKFVDGVAVSESVSPEIEGIIREWKKLLKLDVPIYIATIEDARLHKNDYTGPHRRVGSGTLNRNDFGSTRLMPDGSHYILFTKSTSPTFMLEILAHELGHVHQKTVYEKASEADKKALKDAHQKWLETHKTKTAQEVINSMRGRAIGQRRVKAAPTQKGEELPDYWRKFEEWYADQTARWAVSNKAPVTVVEKFFKRLGNQLRRFYQQLKARKYLPEETFAQYMDRVTAQPPVLTPDADDTEYFMATDTGAASSMSANAGQAGWTERRIKRLINEFGYTDGRTYGIAAFVNPADFVRATTPDQKAVEYIREGAGPLDLKQLSEETQTPFLDIDMEKGAIIGHEGRHRMQAMADAGITRAAVVIWARDRYGSKQPAQYDPVDAMTVSGQRFAGGRGQYLSLSNLVPLEYRQEKRLLDEFGDPSSTILYNIDPTSIGGGLKSSRDEKIKQYAKLRAALARVPREVAAGKASIDMQRNTTELMQAVRDLQTEIKITKPRLDSAEQFLSKALKEYDAGNISKDVLDVINAAYQKYPELLEGLLLRVRAEPNRGMAAGGFDPWNRIILLYKGGSGATDPSTIRHEIAHALEQMMTPEQRSAVVQAWGKAFARAIKKHPDAAHQKYFNAVFDFLDSPTERSYRKAQSALPSYDMYQFINPSEFWAVNAESLMGAQLGTAWDKFKRGIRRAWEGIKKVLGFDNRSDIHKVFAQVMGGSRERVTKLMVRDIVSLADTKFRTLENIDEERRLMERYSRPHTPMLDNTPVTTVLTNVYKRGKEVMHDAVTNPIEAAASVERGISDGLLSIRNQLNWYGAGLESRDFARYKGQLRTSAGFVTSSVALDNAIRSGNIGVEVVFRGGLEYDSRFGNYVAVERDLGMRGVYENEAALKKRLGDQLGTDIIQGYLEAKRSISIMNELADREVALENAKDNRDTLVAMGAPPEDIAKAKELVAQLEVELDGINKAVTSVNMSEEEMVEFAALEDKHPELRKIMDNWTAVNQNLLKVWRQVGLLSQGRYETLAAIKDYVPWQRIMNDEEDIHSSGQAVQSTTRSLTAIGREKLFKVGRPRNVADFTATAGQKDFKIRPTSVVKVRVNGKLVKSDLVTATPDGNVRIDMDLNDGDFVTFETNREIQNIIDNMTRNVMRMTMNGIRQFAANRIVLEYAVRNEEGKIRVYPSVDPAEGKFSWMVNGKKVIVQIQDPLVVASIYGMDNINLKMWEPLAAVANLVRRSVTLSGVFQVKQVFKDAPTAALVTGVRNPMALIGGVWKGFLTSLIQPGVKKAGVDIEPVVDILKAAGIGGFHSPARTPEAELKRRLGIMNRNVYSAVIKGLDHIGDSSDMAQRVAVYKRVMKETGDQMQAVYQAANVINFLHHGSAGLAQSAVKLVPFLGAWANSTDVLINSLQGGGLKGMSRKKAIARLAVAATTLSGITLLYCMLAGGDPEYDELDDQTKLRNFIIPGTKIMLPINTSAALFFKAIPELIYNKITRDGTENENDARRLRRALAEVARDALLGPEPIPAGVKTIVEVGINHSFFTGRPVTPESLKGVEAAEQYVASTSELGKKISAYLTIPGTTKSVLNPMEADHIVRGLFGTAGAMAQWVTNSIEASTRPEPTEREKPITGSFKRDEVPRGNEDLFYDFKEVIAEKYKTLQKIIDREDFDAVDAYIDKHGDIAGMNEYINQTEQDLKDINAEIRRLGESRDKSMTPQERRQEIAEMQRLRAELLSPVKELRRETLPNR